MSETELRTWLSGYPAASSPGMAIAIEPIISSLREGGIVAFDPGLPEHVAMLTERGLQVAIAKGSDNLIVLDRRFLLSGAGAGGLRINFPVTHGLAAARNTLMLGVGSAIYGEINFRGLDNLCVIAGPCGGTAVLFNLIMNKVALGIGPGCSLTRVNCGVQGEGRVVSIGAGCRFEGDNWLRTSDAHAIIDMESRTVINPSADVSIGCGVTLAQDAIVMKGTVIGDGVTVDPGSLVSGIVRPGLRVAGVPAREVAS